MIDGAYPYGNAQTLTVKAEIFWLLEKGQARRQLAGTLSITNV